MFGRRLHTVSMHTERFSAEIEQQGWSVIESGVDERTLAQLEAEIAPLVADAADRGGVRNLLADSAAVAALGQSGPLRALATSVLGEQCGVVRVIYFDKTPETNWRVIWHQDLTIAVQREHPTPGYGPWSQKAGVVHVQPPVDVLERMLAVRLHLDDCDTDNGPVRVIPGSHRDGRLSPNAIDEWKARDTAVECHARRGGVLAFRPLLLHASSQARVPRHRRVLHFEYAAADLPTGVQWHSWIGVSAD